MNVVKLSCWGLTNINDLMWLLVWILRKDAAFKMIYLKLYFPLCILPLLVLFVSPLLSWFPVWLPTPPPLVHFPSYVFLRLTVCCCVFLFDNICPPTLLLSISPCSLRSSPGEGRGILITTTAWELSAIRVCTNTVCTCINTTAETQRRSFF